MLKPVLKYLFSKNSKNFYKILQVQTNATSQDIKKNYYRLAKQYHPDKNIIDNEKFKLITQAYNCLKDTQKRKIYDQQQYLSTNKPNTYNYHKNFHYGYTKRNKYNQNKQNYYNNPYANSYDYNFNTNFDPLGRQQERVNKNKMKSQAQINQKLRKVLVIGFGLVSIAIIAELIIKIYQFNAIYRRNSYPQYLDPDTC